MMRATLRSAAFAAATLAVASVSATAAAAEKYQVDSGHASVHLRAKHFGIGYVYGQFDPPSGTIVLDPKDVSKSSVELSIDAATLDTNNDKRDKDLTGPDFLDAKQFPKITFKSKKVSAAGGKGDLKITGDLTLHGVTKPITVTAKKTGEGDDPWGNHRVGYVIEFTVKRNDFGVTHMPQAASNEVDLVVAVEGMRKK